VVVEFKKKVEVELECLNRRHSSRDVNFDCHIGLRAFISHSCLNRLALPLTAHFCRRRGRYSSQCFYTIYVQSSSSSVGLHLTTLIARDWGYHRFVSFSVCV